jgi:hypothetical protein
MTPELATQPKIIRTDHGRAPWMPESAPSAHVATIQPAVPLTLVAWAVDELDAVPTAVGHCYICGMLPGLLHRDESTEDSMHHGARRPQTLREVAGEARSAALAVLGIDRVPTDDWGPDVAAAVRRVARDLDTMAWCAENP